MHRPFGALLRLVIYAVVTALITLGFAFILFNSPAEQAEEDAAFQEVENHRIASRCYFAAVIDGQRTILREMGVPESGWPPLVDVSGIDCTPVPDIMDPSPADGP